MNKISNYFERLLIFLIYLSFFCGFFNYEDAAGGGKIDLNHVYHNIQLFKNNNFFNITWDQYDSTSLPLYYLITKYLIPFNDIFVFKLFTFFLSLCSIFFFYKILKIKFGSNNGILLASSIPLLSPYFRTSAFWGIEENIAYFFFLISSFFFLKNIKDPRYSLIAIIAACLTFYARQNYAFLVIIFFFYFFNFKKFFSINNFSIICLFLLFLLPSLYFFYEWGGLVNNKNISSSRIYFQLFNIPIILSIFFFYYIPIIFLNIKTYYKKFFSIKKIILLFILFLVYYILFKIDARLLFTKNIGSGVIYKLFFNFGFFNDYPDIALILFLFISFLGLIFSIYLCINNYNYFTFFIISLFIFSFANIIFQEYFDPLIYFFIFIFGNIFKKKDLKYICRNYLIFYFILLLSSLIYRSYISII
jgi:hypothetical protein